MHNKNFKSGIFTINVTIVWQQFGVATYIDHGYIINVHTMIANSNNLFMNTIIRLQFSCCIGGVWLFSTQQYFMFKCN